MTFSVNTMPEQEYSTALTRGHPFRQIGLLGVLQDRHYLSAYRARLLGVPVREKRAVAYLQFDKAQSSYLRQARKRAIKSLRTAQSNSVPVRLCQRIWNSLKTMCTRHERYALLKVSPLPTQ